ncbi:MAG: PolC-type DNA polymerase III [Oscillospiraceae bacterium]
MTARPFKGSSIVAFPQRFVVVDIETTGMSPADSEIIEISAVRFAQGKRVETFSTLVKPNRRIGRFITNLTGITSAMTADAPRIAEAIEAFDSFLGRDIIVGYNVNFDVNYLYDAMMCCQNRPLSNDFVDVLRMTRRLFPELSDHKQTTVAAYLGISTVGAHRAETDCLICAAVMERMKQLVLDRGETEEDFCKSFSRTSRRKSTV